MSDSATIYGIDRNDYIWNPNFKVRLDSKGKWTGSEGYTCRLADVTKLLPKIGAYCTLAGWNFLTVTEIEVENIEGDLAEVNFSYSSYQEGGDFQFNENNLNNYTYDLSIQASDEPITTFHKFRIDDPISDEEWLIIKQYIDGLAKPKDGTDKYTFISVADETTELGEVTSEEGKKLCDFLAVGVETYYVPRQIWRITYTSRSRPSASDLNDVGKIGNPKGAPSLAGGRNWLLNGLNVTESDKIFTITEEWLLSDIGGWDEYLYED